MWMDLETIIQSKSEKNINVYLWSLEKWYAAKSLQSCLTLQPHRWQPTRLPRPWGSPGKNTSGLPFPSPRRESEKWKWSCSVVSDSSRPHGLQPSRLLRPWDFPGKSTWVGYHCLPWVSALSRGKSHSLNVKVTYSKTQMTQSFTPHHAGELPWLMIKWVDPAQMLLYGSIANRLVDSEGKQRMGQIETVPLKHIHYHR